MNRHTHAACLALIYLFVFTSSATAQPNCFEGVQPARFHGPLDLVYTGTNPRRTTLCTSPPDGDSLRTLRRTVQESLRVCRLDSTPPARAVVQAVLRSGRIASLRIERGRLSFGARCLSDRLRAISIPPPGSRRRLRSCSCSWEHVSMSFDVF